MAINFASSLFKPAIYCNKVSRDGYSISNLISSNSSERIKGYMAESFIKTPVTVVIRFCCNIEVSHLILHTAVGSQITSGLEVFTKSDKIEMTSLENDPPELSPDVTSGIFTFLGKAIDLETTIFCFKNKHFKALKSHLQPNFNNLSEGTLCRDLRRNSAKSLNHVSHVMIRLTLTRGGKIPALKSLEVWGQPSFSCSKATVSCILKSFQESCIVFHDESDEDEVFEEKSSPITSLEETFDNIPTDFIDSITCSLMSMPILLPSGHTIDQQTLDKYIDTEATWGRGPSDPFTGVPFTENNEPVPNVALKARLDQYLLSCGNDSKFKDVARSLGRKSSSHIPKSSILVTQKEKEPEIIKKDIKKLKSKEKSSNSKRKSSVKNEKASLKWVKTESGAKDSKNVKKEIPISKYSDKTDTVNDCISSDKYVVKSLTKPISDCKSNEQKCHAYVLKESLDCALLNTLSSLPSFLSKTSVWQNKLKNGGVNVNMTCISCKTETHTLFKLPCNHNLCRTCLVSKNNSRTCDKCQQAFKSSDPVRIHF